MRDITGHAALAICESLLLALNDHKVLPESEIVGVLKDAAAAHEGPQDDDESAAMHKAVAELIHRIIDGGNSVRRPKRSHGGTGPTNPKPKTGDK